MSEWKRVKLGEICKISAGGDRPSLVSEKETNYCQIPIYSNGIDNQGLYGFTNKAKIKGDAITITGRGANAGTVFYRKTAFYPIIRLLSLEPYNDIINPRYLYYLIKDRTFLSTGSAQPQITVPNISDYVISYNANIVDQQRIATILSRYDSLIENYQKQIKLLEESAQRLYKEWFIDLRFPGHENTKIVDGVPEGWEKKKVGDIVKIKSGYAFKSKDWQKQGCPVVKIKDISGVFVNRDSLDYVSSNVVLKAQQYLLNKMDLVIAMTGATIGKIGLITDDGLYANQRVGKFFSQNTIDVPYLYCFFKQTASIEQIVQISSASSAQPNISGSQLESLEILYNVNILKEFNLKCYKYFRQMIHLYSQIHHLTEARDRLLPKLMSGEIEV